MDAMGTGFSGSPLRELLRSRVERVLASWEGAGAPPAPMPQRGALRRFLRALDEMDEAADVLHEEPAAPRIVLLAANDPGLAPRMQRLLGDRHRLELVSSSDRAVLSAAEQTPHVLVAEGAAQLKVVRAVRELRQALPVLITALEHEVPAILREFADDPVVVLRGSPQSEELALAVRAMLEMSSPCSARAPSPSLQPRSYAHLAGLLPRALERMIDFDVGAAVIARHGSDPLVDVHSTRDCPEDALAQARERCLALFRVVRGGTLRAEDAAALWGPSLLKSSLHVPLASEGSVVGVTLLASLQPGAFSTEDEDALRDLATHTSGAYRRLEGSVRRLRLTPRQSQVLALIASGLSDREVADRLGLAHRTVRTHLDRLLREHGLHGRTEAVAAWLRGEQG
jgi:DNA-binding NarL/FixJ family response regulator